MRAFIAIGSGELKDYFLDIQKQLPKETAKLSLTGAFHLTLKFLGEVPEDKISKIKEKLSAVSFQPFKITTSEIGFFPNEDWITVIWVGAEPKEEITALQKRIDNALFPLFEKETRFHPHITLARVKFISDTKEFIGKIKSIETEEKEINVRNFKLMKSTLTRDGAVYGELMVFG